MKKLLAIFAMVLMFLQLNAEEVVDLKEPSSEVKRAYEKA